MVARASHSHAEVGSRTLISRQDVGDLRARTVRADQVVEVRRAADEGEPGMRKLGRFVVTLTKSHDTPREGRNYSRFDRCRDFANQPRVVNCFPSFTAAGKDKRTNRKILCTHRGERVLVELRTQQIAGSFYSPRERVMSERSVLTDASTYCSLPESSSTLSRASIASLNGRMP